MLPRLPKKCFFSIEHTLLALRPLTASPNFYGRVLRALMGARMAEPLLGLLPENNYNVQSNNISII